MSYRDSVDIELDSDTGTVTLTPKASTRHQSTLIWLHELGASGEIFKDLFLEKRLVPLGCKVVLPTAPKRRVNAMGGRMENSWFDIQSFNRERFEKDTTSNYS